MHASHMIGGAARLDTGWPEDDVRDSIGRISPPQRGEPGACACCGSPARWRLSDAISELHNEHDGKWIPSDD